MKASTDENATDMFKKCHMRDCVGFGKPTMFTALPVYVIVGIAKKLSWLDIGRFQKTCSYVRKCLQTVDFWGALALERFGMHRMMAFNDFCAKIHGFPYSPRLCYMNTRPWMQRQGEVYAVAFPVPPLPAVIMQQFHFRQAALYITYDFNKRALVGNVHSWIGPDASWRIYCWYTHHPEFPLGFVNTTLDIPGYFIVLRKPPNERYSFYLEESNYAMTPADYCRFSITMHNVMMAA